MLHEQCLFSTVLRFRIWEVCMSNAYLFSCIQIWQLPHTCTVLCCAFAQLSFPAYWLLWQLVVALRDLAPHVVPSCIRLEHSRCAFDMVHVLFWTEQVMLLTAYSLL